MSLIRLHRTIRPHSFTKVKCFSTVATQEDEEYTATPQYPPILDLSYEKRMERKREAKHEELRKVKTVEEKQLKVNMPRYYGFKSYMLLEEQGQYNSLPLAQHVTRTHFIKEKDLPECYQGINVDDITGISEDIQEALLMEIEETQRIQDLKEDKLTDVERENIISSSVVKSINRVLNNHLAHQYPHILDNKIDIEPRLESSWVVGGIEPDTLIKKRLQGHEFFKQFVNDPIDRTFCYLGSPTLTIRAEQPLPTIISPSDAENPALEVPHFKYDPRVLGMGIDHRHAANIPGFWPGDSHTFGLISFLKTGYMLERKKLLPDEIDNEEAMHRQAILSSYAWLHSQANYLGFTTYNDLTYPLVTQTVLTNGKDFRFYIYQLNTIILHSKNTLENPKRNVCWSNGNMKLYEEINDGKIVGFNDDLVKTLVKLYKNEPKERLGINLRPYLSQTEKLIADYEDDEKRKWLEKEYKYIVSNRPRFKEFDEIYSWEKIYKIDHKTRGMDKRRRFFELFQKPWRRTLDDRLPEYVPRCLRPELPKRLGRRVKEFWP
ncbi:28S ribosomal protein S30, mitochondrial [Anthonomus grandis grandis]|uniref:28S ribosomal protein S30, mitochondrial n=1 Tax=Anthonomus grandis grandis TaxID=2921223 RepID=UPI002165DD8A|nr:28S ribosomal protein S30, mitochondrial [Anthonomus grandis grandis]